MTYDWYDIETYLFLLEDVKGEANAYCWAIDNQLERIFSIQTKYASAPVQEFHFLITALWRLRVLLVALQRTGRCGGVNQTLGEFDDLLPGLKEIRDTLEHYDERLMGRMMTSRIEWSYMRSWQFGKTVIWRNAGVVSQPNIEVDSLDRKDLSIDLNSVRGAMQLVLGFLRQEMSSSLKLRRK